MHGSAPLHYFTVWKKRVFDTASAGAVKQLELTEHDLHGPLWWSRHRTPCFHTGNPWPDLNKPSGGKEGSITWCSAEETAEANQPVWSGMSPTSVWQRGKRELTWGILSGFNLKVAQLLPDNTVSRVQSLHLWKLFGKGRNSSAHLSQKPFLLTLKTNKQKMVYWTFSG